MTAFRSGASGRRGLPGGALFVGLAWAGLLALASGAGCKSQRKEVTVLAAASLARALADLEVELEQRDPTLDMRLEISGSQTACRKISELNRRADLVATADVGVIREILMPRWASWAVSFTTNELVLAHLEHSRHTAEVTRDNWARVLLRPGVRLGLVDPDLAPVGYRTLLLLQLAEKTLAAEDRTLAGLTRRLRAGVPAERVVPHEAELMRLLQSRTIDYAFVYRSTAEEHNLKTVPLPDAYNLGAASRAAAYGAASIRVKMRGDRPAQLLRGAPVTYGVTIPTDPPNPAGAEQVLRALLTRPGRRSLQRTGFRPLVPPRCSDPALPPRLRALVKEP